MRAIDDENIDETTLNHVIKHHVENEIDRRFEEYGITLEINGEIIDITEIKRFPGECKIVAVYHHAPGFAREG